MDMFILQYSFKKDGVGCERSETSIKHARLCAYGESCFGEKKVRHRCGHQGKCVRQGLTLSLHFIGSKQWSSHEILMVIRNSDDQCNEKAPLRTIMLKILV